MDTYGREEVSRGAVFLVGVLTAHLIAQQEGGEGGLDPLSDLIPGVIRRLPTFEMADPAQVPMAAGVLLAAAMGMDSAAWRDRFGPILPKEALVHTFVLWLLADLFDFTAEQPGAVDRLIREAFDIGVLREEPEQGRCSQPFLDGERRLRTRSGRPPGTASRARPQGVPASSIRNHCTQPQPGPAVEMVRLAGSPHQVRELPVQPSAPGVP
ncbi:hypothetical protein [Streptomyces sp. NPDC058240]|uniref:hypothetical protein n=1 Tax=Streptomyces sp. NPDC058240 TaxID=3346396 RepID=UPI0036E56E84